MNQPEICLNLWYVRDEEGFIYSLRARAYFLEGSDDDKLRELQRLSLVDYLIAKAFPIPQRYQLDKTGVFVVRGLQILPTKTALFEDAIQFLQSEMPFQTPFDIPDKPLVCITPLIGDDDGNISLKIDEINYF
jgi:hypothetical protein